MRYLMLIEQHQNQEDTRELTRLSNSSLRRDWDSEADSIYDDEPFR